MILKTMVVYVDFITTCPLEDTCPSAGASGASEASGSTGSSSAAEEGVAEAACQRDREAPSCRSDRGTAAAGEAACSGTADRTGNAAAAGEEACSGTDCTGKGMAAAEVAAGACSDTAAGEACHEDPSSSCSSSTADHTDTGEAVEEACGSGSTDRTGTAAAEAAEAHRSSGSGTGTDTDTARRTSTWPPCSSSGCRSTLPPRPHQASGHPLCRSTPCPCTCSCIRTRSCRPPPSHRSTPCRRPSARHSSRSHTDCCSCPCTRTRTRWCIQCRTRLKTSSLSMFVFFSLKKKRNRKKEKKRSKKKHNGFKRAPQHARCGQVCRQMSGFLRCWQQNTSQPRHIYMELRKQQQRGELWEQRAIIGTVCVSRHTLRRVVRSTRQGRWWWCDAQLQQPCPHQQRRKDDRVRVWRAPSWRWCSPRRDG